MKFQFWRQYHDFATIVSTATAQRYCGASASVSVATLFYGCSLFVCKQCRSHVTATAQSKPQSPLL